MNTLITTNPSTTMTLKEITDLLNIRHDKAMIKVDRMAKEPEFGAVSKMDIVYNDQGQKIETYILDKRQSIAVSSALNTALLMRVIDRWQELESQSTPSLPQSFAEALQLAADQAKQLELAAPKVAFVDNLVERDTLMTATQVGQKHKISAVKLNKFLDELGGVYNKSVKRGRAFTQSFIDKGYGELKQSEQGYSQALFTPLGEVWVNQQLVSEGMV